MSEKNKWALPSGAKEQIGPKWRKEGQQDALGRQVGVPTYFLLIRKSRRFYITYQKMKEIPDRFFARYDFFAPDTLVVGTV